MCTTVNSNRRGVSIKMKSNTEKVAIKNKELTVKYDVNIPTSKYLLEYTSGDENSPELITPSSETVIDIVEDSWDKNINKADKTDYLLAVASGTIAAAVDIFYTGEFSLEEAKQWGNDTINKFVKRMAKWNGYKGDDLSDAIKFMEKRFPLAADKNTRIFGGGLQHHLRDFTHHFSIGGLMCSIFTQFTKKVIGTDTNGKLIIEDVKDDKLIGKNNTEKILFGTVYWFFHMVSDMAGSNATAGNGTGIPGPIVSLIKELSSLPVFRNKQIGDIEFHTWVSKLFNGTLLGKRDEAGKLLEPMKFDLRTEIGVLREIGKQVVPVLINESLVRSFYFIRRLSNELKREEIKSFNDFEKINVEKILPFNNRTIKRMVTVSSGTLVALDAADAAVRAGLKNGIHPKFFVDFAVRINVVGVGRFIVACKADSEYIAEDIREAKKKRDEQLAKKQEFEKSIVDLNCLSLDFEEMRILYSLENLIVSDDISITKNKEDEDLKRTWQRKWQEKLITMLSSDNITLENFFLNEKEIQKYLGTNSNEMAQYLIVLEAMLFEPYYAIFEDDNDKKLKKLKNKSKYLLENYTHLQDLISAKEIEKIKKVYRKSVSKIAGADKGMIVGAIGTAAVMIASAALAFTFAPIIAVALVGNGAAGLSGAALISHCLAVLGGGSLAAGGLGMAGGTAVITGGGALLGMVSGTGMSATTVYLLTQEGYVLSECSRLLTYCKVVLKERLHDEKSIIDIYTKLESQIDTIKNSITEFERNLQSEDKKEQKENKKKIKVAKNSLKYLESCLSELQKLVKDAK